MICASNPQSMVTAIQGMGYKAVLTKDSGGDPQITSSASGYNYDIFFYDCKNNVNCTSVQFQIVFSKDSVNSADLANEWNSKQRLGSMHFNKEKGTLVIQYDISTVGGINQKNFADVVSWWDSTLGEAAKFFKEHPGK